jgi:hypothetical protein
LNAPTDGQCALDPISHQNKKARSSSPCTQKGFFAWKTFDMKGIPREVVEHSLRVNPKSKSVKQRLCQFDEEKRRAIGEEMSKLLTTAFIREINHPESLSNPVLVRKKSRKWRMCFDYTGLNKACPKDSFPLPRIDHVVDSSSGCEMLSFLDTYSGYPQIVLKQSDQPVASLITAFNSYCYVTMSFGLKNAGAT